MGAYLFVDLLVLVIIDHRPFRDGVTGGEGGAYSSIAYIRQWIFDRGGVLISCIAVVLRP